MNRPGFSVRIVSRAAAMALLASAGMILFASPERFNPWFFLAFLTCFVGGVMLLTGLVTWPSARQSPSASNRGERHPPQAPAVFVPPRPPLVLALLIILMAAGFLALVVLAAVGVIQFRDASRSDVAGFVVPCLAVAWFLPAYLKRHGQVSVRVDTAGIEARSYLRHIRVGWDDVTSLTHLRVLLILGGGRVYRVRSSRGTFEFFSTWSRAEALADIIARATGLAWHHE